MFGTDGEADSYKTEWVNKWIKIDGEILSELGVSDRNIEKLFGKNTLRFIGKTKERVNHLFPVPDNAGGWSPKD
ncbi:MAG: hypothetical protein WCX81_01290 [Monoglobales bacterium]